MCAVYQYTFWDIRNQIYAKPIITELDKRLLRVQERTLGKLKLAILTFVSVSWILIIFDVYSIIYQLFDPNVKSCEVNIFSGSWSWFNTIIWTFKRIIDNMSPEFLAIYVFYKPNVERKSS
jgi:hypothetical protein